MPITLSTQTNRIQVVIFDTLTGRRTRLWMSLARTPGTLFAAMDAPTPLPHSATPRPRCSQAIALPEQRLDLHLLKNGCLPDSVAFFC